MSLQHRDTHTHRQTNKQSRQARSAHTHTQNNNTQSTCWQTLTGSVLSVLYERGGDASAALSASVFLPLFSSEMASRCTCSAWALSNWSVSASSWYLSSSNLSMSVRRNPSLRVRLLILALFSLFLVLNTTLPLTCPFACPLLLGVWREVVCVCAFFSMKLMWKTKSRNVTDQSAMPKKGSERKQREEELNSAVTSQASPFPLLSIISNGSSSLCF